MKLRRGPDGLHLFDRKSGLNILLDEMAIPVDQWSPAPRQVSIALTNLCDLHCPYCYAPKHKATLAMEDLRYWLKELDEGGCFGVGFGGGEPTLHPEFIDICSYTAANTALAVTLTTHGHRLRPQLLERLAGNVHFMRISVDGVGSTYEKHRGRSYAALVSRLAEARQICGLGINVVINDHTALELDQVAALAAEVHASELLLLPQQKTLSAATLSPHAREALHQWVSDYRGTVPLAVSVAGAEGLPTCDPLPKEAGLRGYAHIDASGYVKASSFDKTGVQIAESGIMAALRRLE